ncbi:triosephosphate isomerase [Syntrophobotulus glycolicus DSM 8271]|uniref:Triosephosphate isomerase n=1 Tax=Syntrophobotulus glycolicus (strain DSM 8271 / FlGlyR) TaxID=645991 RepID=F0T1Q3_SYNGF|nr:triosephosphate isomerase [Syntrophobotulus glycolicus DSM 8271]
MNSRKQLIAGNWKMFMNTQQAREFALDFQGRVADVTDKEIVICAPFTALHVLKEEWEEGIIHIGAQDVFYQKEGAYTGEISPAMLVDLACTYVIIGHSERRGYLKENDELIAQKIKAALENNLKPILCVGENLSQREDGKALSFVRSQVEKDLSELSSSDIGKIVIAYEPVWAIGTGKTASPQDAQEMCAAIRSTLAGIAGAAANNIQILYGGSVKADNIKELTKKKDIDGALVGGASLDPKQFADLIHNA